MQVAVSVVSAHLQETQKRWKLEAVQHPNPKGIADWDASVPEHLEQDPVNTVSWLKSGFRILGREQLTAPAFENAGSFGGLLFTADLPTGEITWRSNWGNCLATPSGICRADGGLWVADLEGSNIFLVDIERRPGTFLRRVSHPALNDTHGIARTRRGLLVASTGTDMVIELDLEGRSLYQWWAGDHGFRATPSGLDRAPHRDRDHRAWYYHTRYHATHLNAARYRDPEETQLLVLLWRQGQLVEIDTTLPAADQHPSVVLDGLYHPHTLRPLSGGGWLVANTQGRELIELAPDLSVHRRIPSARGWIQDALYLGDDRWLVADVNSCRLLIHDQHGRQLEQFEYDTDWRVFGLEMLSGVPSAAEAAAGREDPLAGMVGS